MLLGMLKWQAVGPKNEDIACVNRARHGKLRKETDENDSQAHGADGLGLDSTQAAGSSLRTSHGIDLVTVYLDPYEDRGVYSIIDLKALGHTSIDANFVTKSVRSMSVTLECAAQSQEWRDTYLQAEQGLQRRIVGILFLHQHKMGPSPKAWADVVANGLAPPTARILEAPPQEPATTVPAIYIWTGDHVDYLHSVHSMLERRTIEGISGPFTPFVPDRVRSSASRFGKLVGAPPHPVPLEQVQTGIIMFKGTGSPGTIVFCREGFQTRESLEFFIGRLEQLQLFAENSPVVVMALNLAREAHGYLRRERDARGIRRGPKLDSLSLKELPLVRFSLSPEEVANA